MSEEKLLDLYMLIIFWSDGEEEYPAILSLVRAKDEAEARELIADLDVRDLGEGETEADRRAAWKNEAKCEQVGWATGPDSTISEVLFLV